MSEADFLHLVFQFEEHTLPKEEWTHHAHLAVAFSHVERFGLERSLDLLREKIRAYNRSVGTANTESQGYHDTITWFWLQIVADYYERTEGSCVDRYHQFLQSDQARQDHIFHFYSRDYLFTQTARLGIVEPDLQAIGRND